jgi:hypothetical protein
MKYLYGLFYVTDVLLAVNVILYGIIVTGALTWIFLYRIISFICLATNCVTNIDQSKRENKKLPDKISLKCTLCNYRIKNVGT